MTVRLRFPDHRLFPYERELALREVAALGAELVDQHDDGSLTLNGAPGPDALRRFTYISQIELADGEVLIPDAARLDATSREVRGHTATRQLTRYHLHGIHEYKGKFNPQVVRAFANLLGVREAEWIIDPFCGSGTTLLEGLSLGANVLGVDRSPIAVLIARGKSRAFVARAPAAIADELLAWSAAAAPEIDKAQTQGKVSAPGLRHLDETSLEYARRWFPTGALAGLSVALAGRDQLTGTSRRLLEIAISSLCRDVSYQLPEDLRIRRRPDGFEPPPVATLLAKAIESTALGLQEVAKNPPPRGPRALVRLGSASAASLFAPAKHAARRVVITSPPYATALPYIDTDRLSIALLGLDTADHLGPLERSLIGSREWTTVEARRWARALLDDRDQLPRPVVQLCRELAALQRDAGFRRKAVPGLLYRYFVSMRAALTGTRAGLRAGDPAVLIVGTNRTNTDEGPVDIDTPRFLSLVAEQAGFATEELLPLDTYARYGLHQANGITSETALMLRAVESI